MVITSEEKTMVADAIILELALDTLEEEQNSIEESKNILRRAHHIINELVMQRIREDLKKIKREMYRNRIRYVASQHNEEKLRFEYWCRGFPGAFAFTRERGKNEVLRRIGKISMEIEQFILKR